MPTQEMKHENADNLKHALNPNLRKHLIDASQFFNQVSTSQLPSKGQFYLININPKPEHDLNL